MRSVKKYTPKSENASHNHIEFHQSRLTLLIALVFFVIIICAFFDLITMGGYILP